MSQAFEVIVIDPASGRLQRKVNGEPKSDSQQKWTGLAYGRCASDGPELLQVTALPGVEVLDAITRMHALQDFPRSCWFVTENQVVHHNTASSIAVAHAAGVWCGVAGAMGFGLYPDFLNPNQWQRDLGKPSKVKGKDRKRWIELDVHRKFEGRGAELLPPESMHQSKRWAMTDAAGMLWVAMSRIARQRRLTEHKPVAE